MTNNKQQDIRRPVKHLNKKQWLISGEVLVLAIVSALFVIGAYYVVAHAETAKVELTQPEEPAPTRVEKEKKLVRKTVKTITTKVTGYNTVPEQTDNTPCIASSGENICGKKNVVACPRELKVGTIVEIHGKEYKCLDILAEKFDHRFDISCDKDFKCPYEVTGTTEVKVIKYSYE